VTGEIFGGLNVVAILLTRGKIVDGGEGEEERDDQRARTAHTRGGWKIAREYDIGPAQRTGKVHRDAACNGDRIVGPVSWLRLYIGRQIQLHDLARVRIEHAHRVARARGWRVCRTRAGDHADSALNRAQQTPTTAVVRMLAQNLDSPRHPECHRVVSCRRRVSAEPREIAGELRDSPRLDL